MPDDNAIGVANEYLESGASSAGQEPSSNPYVSTQGKNAEIEELIRQAKEYLNRDSQEFKLAMQMAAAYYRGDWMTCLSYLQEMRAGNKVNISNQALDWVNMMINQQNVSDDRSYQTGMRDTSVTSTANQLQTLGLSPSGVLQIGGSTAGVQSAVAGNYKGDFAKRDLDKYMAKWQLGKSLLSMTGQMASAGIYGHAIAQAKKAAEVVTSSAAHSAYGALTGVSKSWDSMIKDLDTPGQYDNNPGVHDMSDWLLK